MNVNPKSLAFLTTSIISMLETVPNIEAYSDEEIAAAFKSAAAIYDNALGANAQRALFAQMVNKGR